jgi:hypothetical protein
MMGDDPGRCVKQVIVGGGSLCFEFNRDYYWCRGYQGEESIRLTPPSNEPPYYSVLPVHYERLYLAGAMGCGIDRSRQLFCWGDNRAAVMPGEQGILHQPTAMSNLPRPIDDFAASGLDYCSRSGSDVWCNASKRILQVEGLGHVTHLATGVLYGCAANDRALWCWSLGATWPLLPAPPLNKGSRQASEHRLRAGPITLPESLRIRSLHLGSVHGCVLGEDDSVHCFGDNQHGNWGTGQRLTCEFTTAGSCPERREAHFVETLGNTVKELGVNGVVSCALKRDGSVWCWGNNQHRTVSDRETLIEERGHKLFVEPLPLQRTELGFDNRRLMVATGHACVEKNDGALWCWGSNRAGQFDKRDVAFIPPRPIELPAPRCSGAP